MDKDAQKKLIRSLISAIYTKENHIVAIDFTYSESFRIESDKVPPE
jgi:hypothetical protein